MTHVNYAILFQVHAKQELQQEFESHMAAHTLRFLQLDERHCIGYTLKCMGAGFWALRQTDFRQVKYI